MIQLGIWMISRVIDDRYAQHRRERKAFLVLLERDSARRWRGLGPKVKTKKWRRPWSLQICRGYDDTERVTRKMRVLRAARSFATYANGAVGSHVPRRKSGLRSAVSHTAARAQGSGRREVEHIVELELLGRAGCHGRRDG